MRPLLGNWGYIRMLDNAVSSGHITDGEFAEQLSLHFFVIRARGEIGQ